MAPPEPFQKIVAKCKSCKPTELAAVATLAFEETGRLMADTLRANPPNETLACAAGCAWCCYATVAVSVPEALRLAEYLRKTLSVDELAALQQRLAARVQARRSMSIVRWERTRREPCVLLNDNQCSAYSARPLACRGANSTDAKACEQGLIDRQQAIPAYVPQLTIYQQARNTIGVALHSRGGPGPLELTAALLIALRLPDDQALSPSVWSAAVYTPPDSERR